jgi:hypothetical protein
VFTPTEAAFLWLVALAIGFIAFCGGLLGAFVGIWIRPFIAATDIQLLPKTEDSPVPSIQIGGRRRKREA